jgi:hypothetical protein
MKIDPRCSPTPVALWQGFSVFLPCGNLQNSVSALNSLNIFAYLCIYLSLGDMVHLGWFYQCLWRMAASTDIWVPSTLKKWEAEPTPEGGGPTDLFPVRSRLPPRGFPRWQDLPHLRMWALNVVILVVKIGGLLAWTSVFYLCPREYRVLAYRSLPPLEVSSSCICTRMEIRDPLA